MLKNNADSTATDTVDWWLSMAFGITHIKLDKLLTIFLFKGKFLFQTILKTRVF